MKEYVSRAEVGPSGFASRHDLESVSAKSMIIEINCSECCEKVVKSSTSSVEAHQHHDQIRFRLFLRQGTRFQVLPPNCERGSKSFTHSSATVL
jgi:hypothetical protein